MIAVNEHRTVKIFVDHLVVKTRPIVMKCEIEHERRVRLRSSCASSFSTTPKDLVLVRVTVSAVTACVQLFYCRLS
jgi:hypothetical protein